MSDAFFSNVSSLLHLDGANGSTTFTDVKGKTWAGAGLATISTAQSKFGGASALFTNVAANANGRISTPHHSDFNLAASDFTLEAWVYNTATAGNQVIMGKDGVFGSSYPSWGLIINGSRSLALQVGSGNGTSSIQAMASTAAVSLNTWTHVAAVRSGSTVRLFIDGVLDSTHTITATITDGGKEVYIGDYTGNTATNDGKFRGHIDEVRITKGVARYSTTFTAPTAAFPDVGDAFTIPTTGYGKEVLADSPIAYYRLGEASGPAAFDYSGYGRNGTYSGTGVTFGVTGLLSGDADKAAYFDPATDTSQVNCNFNAELYWGCTLEAIVNIDAVQPDDQATIITKRQYFASDFNYFPISLVYQKSDGKLYLNLDTGNNFVTDLQLSAAIGTGVPHHVVGVYRPGGVCELWIDGVRVAFGNFTGTISGNNLNWLIGASHGYAGGVGQHRFKGVIDEVAIYSHALAAYRIEKHANIFKYGVDPQWANVSALLHMDGTNGSTSFIDDKGGTWIAAGNAQISTAQSKFGGASGYFDGAGDEVYTASTAIAAASVLTLEAWVYITENPPASPGWGYPVFGQGGAAGDGEQLFGVTADRKLRFYKGSGVGGAVIDVSSAAGAVPLNAWTHVAATLDGTTARVFVNGVLSGSVAATASWVNTGQPFRIGRVVVVGYSSFQGYFKGWIDDARVTRNVARYTADFTPPAFAFPSAEGTPMGGIATPVTRAWGFVS